MCRDKQTCTLCIHTHLDREKQTCKDKNTHLQSKTEQIGIQTKKNTKKTSTDKNRYVHNKTDIYWQKQISTAKTVVGPYGSNVSTESY